MLLSISSTPPFMSTWEQRQQQNKNHIKNIIKYSKKGSRWEYENNETKYYKIFHKNQFQLRAAPFTTCTSQNMSFLSPQKKIRWWWAELRWIFWLFWQWWHNHVTRIMEIRSGCEVHQVQIRFSFVSASPNHQREPADHIPSYEHNFWLHSNQITSLGYLNHHRAHTRQTGTWDRCK